MSMTPGLSASIEYKAWPGTNWTATLQNVSTQVNIVGVKTTIDPDFHHVGENVHDDEQIGYIAWDGAHWHSKCHSHTDPLTGVVSFSFEHFHEGDDNADHEDGLLGFVDWNGSHWLATLPNVGPIPDGKSLAVLFNLQKIS